MNHPDESIIFGACEPTPVDEELWSLKVVMAKTGLSRSTLYAYIAGGAFPMQRRLGKRRIAVRFRVRTGLRVGRPAEWEAELANRKMVTPVRRSVRVRQSPKVFRISN
jgi:hypothetical protein